MTTTTPTTPMTTTTTTTTVEIQALGPTGHRKNRPRRRNGAEARTLDRPDLVAAPSRVGHPETG